MRSAGLAPRRAFVSRWAALSAAVALQLCAGITYSFGGAPLRGAAREPPRMGGGKAQTDTGGNLSWRSSVPACTPPGSRLARALEVYSGALKQQLGYNQRQLDGLGSAVNLGGYLGTCKTAPLLLVGLAPRSADIALTPPHRALQRTFLRLGHAALPAAGAQAHRLDRRVPECGGLPGHLGGRHGADTAGVLAGDSVRHGRDECRGVV